MLKLRRWLSALWKATAHEFIILCFILVLFPLLAWLVGRGSDWEFTLILIGLVGDLSSIIGFILKYNPTINRLLEVSEESVREIRELGEFTKKSDKRILSELADLKKTIRVLVEREPKRIGTIEGGQKKTDFAKIQEAVVQMFENTQKLAEFTFKLSKTSKLEAAKSLKDWSVEDILDYSATLFYSHQYQTAELCYQVILDTDSNNVDALNDLGATLLTIERNEEALRLLKKALDLASDSSVILNNIGKAYKGLNQPKDAEAFYRQAINVKDKFAGAYTDLSIFLRTTDRFSEALTVAKEGAKDFPQDSDLRTELGMILFILEKDEEGIVELEKALKLNPNNDYAHFTLGLVHYDNNQYIAARDELKIACNLNPTIATYWQMYGLSCMELGLTNNTISALITSEELEPDNPYVLFIIGLMHFKNEMPNEALPYLKRTFDIMPKKGSEEVKRIYAICLASLNRIEEMNTVLNLKPGEVPDDDTILAAAFFGIVTDGTILDYQDLQDISEYYKKWDRLHIYAEKIVEITPELQFVRLLLFGHYFKEGEYEKSLALIEDGLALEPLNQDLRINRTSVLIYLEKYEEAYRYLTGFVEELPENSVVLGNYGTILAIRGEYDEARYYLKKSLSINPNAEFYKSKLEMLDETGED